MNIHKAPPVQQSDPVAAWHAQPARLPGLAPANAMTIDVEDYFQVESFFDVIDRDNWDHYDCRVERNIDLILELLAESGARATFFTLAWIAKRYPAIVRKIVENGHELASHGFDHRRADSQNRAEFRADVERAKFLLQDLSGQQVNGYRAPSFSVQEGNLWVMEELCDAGYLYSSSVYPISHDNYGIPKSPRFAFHPLPDRSFLEIPITTTRLFGRNFPCGGGGFFRLWPYPLSAAALRGVNHRDGRSCVFYFHPWELDPGQPRIAGARFSSRFRHYLNLDKMAPRIRRLLKDFTWRRMDEMFLAPPTSAASP